MKNYYQKQRIAAAILAVILMLLMFPGMLLAQISSTTPSTRCGAGTVTLQATGSGTIKWYTVPFYGTAIPTGVSSEGTVSVVGTTSTFTTKSMSVTKTYFVDAVDGGGCSLNSGSARLPVIATISAGSIQAAIFYASNTFCKSVSGDQLVTRTGTAGGVYSAAAGLVLNSSTGAITPGSSTNGNYTVTYHITTPAAGCTENDATTPVSITTTPVTPSIRYAATSTTPISYCTSAGTVSVTRTGASGGTFSASPTGLTIDGSTGTITPATSLSGTYSVTLFVPGIGGCDAMTAQATNITILQLPTIAISYASPFCNNAISQTVTLTGTGVYTGGTYSSTAGLSIDASTGAINPGASTAGTYTVSYTLTAVSPCGQVVAVTSVTIYPLPTATISGTTAVCTGNSANLSVTLTGASPWTFTYTDGTTPVTITNTTDNPKIISVTPSSTGTYSLTSVNDSHCTGTTSGSSTITVSPQPVATFSYPETPYCSNAVHPFPIFTGGGAAGTFTSTAGLVLDASTGQLNLSSSTAGTYTVTNTITAPSGCSDAIATTSVTITKFPVTTFTYAQSAYCLNGTDPSATIPGGSTAGTFTSSAGLSFTNTSTGAIDLSASTAGNYRVTNTISGSNGCGISAATFDLTVTTPPVVNSITYPAASFCQSSANQDVILDGALGGTYTATAGLSINANTGTINPSTSTPGGPYTVTYTIAAAGGCTPVTATFDVTITPAPTATISYTGTPFCKTLGAGQAVTRTGTSGGTYSSTLGLTLDVSTGAINPGTSTAGDYTVIYTIAAAGGCDQITATTSVTITAQPVVTSITYSAAAFCKSKDVQEVTLNGASGGIYTVAPAGLTLDDASGLITPGTSTAGNYTVTYTVAAAGGCAAVQVTKAATINLLPTPVISGTQTLCMLSSGNVYSTPNVVGHTYAWFVSGGNITAGDGTNSVTVTWVAPFGSLIVTETITATGCSVATDQYSVTLNPLPTASVSGTTAVCQNASSPNVTFTGASGTVPYTFTYKINGGSNLTVTTAEGSSSVTVSQATATAGTYTYALVSVRDASSTTCSQTQSGSAVITVNALPVAGVITGTNAVCMGGSLTLTSHATGTATLTYTWASSNTGVATVSNTGVITPVSAGSTNITYTVTDGSSTACGATSPIYAVTVNALPVAGAITGANTVCMGGSLTLTSHATGTATLTYTWASSNTGVATVSNTGVITPVSAGSTNITYTVTDGSSTECGATSAIHSVTVNAQPGITTTGTVDPVTYSASPQNTTLTYTATTAAPTSYSIDWDASANSAGLADQGNTSFAFAAGGGTLTGVVITAITVTGHAGSFNGTMTLTNANGCIYTKAVTVIVNPVAPTGSASQTFCSGS